MHRQLTAIRKVLPQNPHNEIMVTKKLRSPGEASVPLKPLWGLPIAVALPVKGFVSQKTTLASQSRWILPCFLGVFFCHHYVDFVIEEAPYGLQ